MARGMRTSEVSLANYQLASLADSSNRKKKIDVNSVSRFIYARSGEAISYRMGSVHHPSNIKIGFGQCGSVLWLLISRIAARALQDFVVADSEESLPEESTKGKLWKFAAKCLRSKWFANFIVAIAAFICTEHRICDVFFSCFFVWGGL